MIVFQVEEYLGVKYLVILCGRLDDAVFNGVHLSFSGVYVWVDVVVIFDVTVELLQALVFVLDHVLAVEADESGLLVDILNDRWAQVHKLGGPAEMLVVGCFAPVIKGWVKLFLGGGSFRLINPLEELVCGAICIFWESFHVEPHREIVHMLISLYARSLSILLVSNIVDVFTLVEVVVSVFILLHVYYIHLIVHHQRQALLTHCRPSRVLRRAQLKIVL